MSHPEVGHCCTVTFLVHVGKSQRLTVCIPGRFFSNRPWTVSATLFLVEFYMVGARSVDMNTDTRVSL